MTTPRPNPPQATNPRPAPDERPWIGVLFTCSNQYVRVSRHPDVEVYRARCAECGRLVRFRVGQGGSDARFYEVSC